MFRKPIFNLMAILLIGSPVWVNAQNTHSLTGIVIASDDHQPLPGVSIQWKGKDIGSITNNDGLYDFHFSDAATAKDSLVFSFMGFESKTVGVQQLISNPKETIQLNPSSISIGELVITSLSLRQILDSIKNTNSRNLVSPAMLNGYYREFVFSNQKCTQYADAIYNFHFNNKAKDAGTLNIAASRCMKAPQPKGKDVNYDNFEIFPDSKIDPNKIFDYAFWTEMQSKCFPEKMLAEYTYTMQTEDNGNILIQIDPKKKSESGKYSLKATLRPDFSLIAFKLYVSDPTISKLKERRLLGLGAKVLKFNFEVRYLNSSNGVYPQYFSLGYSQSLKGKFMGITMDEIIEQHSDCVVTSINKTTADNHFESGGIYKKGNICKNGKSMNDDMLKTYTVIQPSAKEKAVIDSLQLQ